MINSELLKDIFYSGFDATCNWQILDELEILIHEGAVNYGQEKISFKDNYLKILDQIRVVDGLGPQGKGHMALKGIAENYLEKLGKRVFFEFYLMGLHPDVVSDDKKIVIECGTTDPAGVLILLSDPNISFIGVLPYPDESNKNLVLHRFSRGQNFLDYKNWKLAKLRETFRKTKK